MSVTCESLDRLVDRASELYTLPRVAMQVLELTRQPTIDAWRLKQCIENDPALTAKLLRVVNSALFGLSRSVADLNQALAILGTKPLKLLVLGFSLPEKLFKNVARDVLDSYWQRTLIKAVAARELCESMPEASGDEAFIAALLQDIGSLVLIQHLEQDYALLIEAGETRGDVLGLERQVLGFDRTELSSRLLEKWQLPEAIVAAARLPATPEEFVSESSHQPLRQIVYLANLVAQVLQTQRPDALQVLLESVRGWTRMDVVQLERLSEGLAAKVAELAQVLSLDLPEKQDYGALLARAYAQLTPVASGAAEELIEVGRQSALLRTDFVCQPTARRASALGTSPAPHLHAQPESIARANGGLAMDADQTNLIAGAISNCRRRRAPLSLLVAQVDHFHERQSTNAVVADQLLARLGSLCQALDHDDLRCCRLTGGIELVLLTNCDRRQAVQLAQRLLDDWRRESQGTQTTVTGTTLSLALVAVALAPRNFSAQQLVAAVSQCLSGARSSGGNCLKSIEL